MRVFFSPLLLQIKIHLRLMLRPTHRYGGRCFVRAHVLPLGSLARHGSQLAVRRVGIPAHVGTMSTTIHKRTFLEYASKQLPTTWNVRDSGLCELGTPALVSPKAGRGFQSTRASRFLSSNVVTQPEFQRSAVAATVRPLYGSNENRGPETSSHRSFALREVSRLVPIIEEYRKRVRHM